MQETTKGLLAVLGACCIWGLSPIYYKALSHIPPGEVLAHRTLWSVLLFAVVLMVQGRVRILLGTLASKDFFLLALAAFFVSSNWGLFIWSVQSGYVVQSSLGYYIVPLFAVLIGVVFFQEKLSRPQIIAVALATGGVVVLGFGLGAAPWISLALAITFGIYGVIKKRLPLGPVISVAAEVTILSPLAILWLILSPETVRSPDQFGVDAQTTLLLICSGIVTGVPLILFSYAMRRVEMTTVGILQYLNPSLQFFVAVALFHETVTLWHVIAFGMIWTALAIYSWGTVQTARRAQITIISS